MSSSTFEAFEDNLCLTGHANYREWAKRFRHDCVSRCIWRLFIAEDITSKPGRIVGDCKNPRAASVDKTATRNNRRTRMLPRTQAQYRAERTLSYLHDRVDPAIRRKIQAFKKPSEAWSYLKRKYRKPEPNRLEIAQKQMEELDPSACASLADFLTQFTHCRNAIATAGGHFLESQSKLKIISGLKPEHVARLNREITFADISRMSLEEFTDLLTAYEADD
ncbi:uncharacterized protein PV07_06260 [Cladophialophora immunda]|uniref:DUF4219 domain-containing protein n=1 Tax=Cladophialophora immunda TaxID=569365 RepID=A0A0D1ZRA0_9EURO|nr:uncharacterized protein PV07_06260 [Cladophialophora immunda]KIW30521.1 hypothetical protein PV07_06260 [Cladophialophora immunda]OQU97133.1 hypothetical protein CLAIMM_03118 [Cladophialophora immunda]